MLPPPHTTVFSDRLQGKLQNRSYRNIAVLQSFAVTARIRPTTIILKNTREFIAFTGRFNLKFPPISQRQHPESALNALWKKRRDRFVTSPHS